MDDRELMERALRSLQASMCRMDKFNYQAALEGRLEDKPVEVIMALIARLKGSAAASLNKEKQG